MARRIVHLSCQGGQMTACGKIVMGQIRTKPQLVLIAPHNRCPRCVSWLAAWQQLACEAVP